MHRLLILFTALFLCAADRVASPGPAPTGFVDARAGLRVLTHPTLGEIWLIHPVVRGAAARPGPGPSGAATAAIARRFGEELAGKFVALPYALARDASFGGPPAPLVILTPGANMGGSSYRRLAEDLAAHGYVVALLHPDGSPGPSAGRYGEAASEIATALGFLTAPDTGWADWIRPGPVGLVGHSLGGAASVLALASAPEGSVAVNLDGDFAGAAAQPAAGPVLYLIGTTDGETDWSRERRRGVWATVSAGSPEAVALQLAEMRHFDATDLSLISDAAPPERRHNRFGPAEPGLTLHRLNALTVAWLDRWLKGDEAAWARARANDPGFGEAQTF